MNPLKHLTFGGYLSGIIWNIQVQQIISMPVQTTVPGTFAPQKFPGRAVLYRPAHRTDGNSRTMGTRLANQSAKNSPTRKDFVKKLYHRIKNKLACGGMPFWQRSFYRTYWRYRKQNDSNIKELPETTLFSAIC